MPKEQPIVCLECFGTKVIGPEEAAGHLIQHWAEEPDPVKEVEAYRRYHHLRDQILARGEVL